MRTQVSRQPRRNGPCKSLRVIMNRLSDFFGIHDSDLHDWAERHWDHWEAQNRFAVKPARRSHAPGIWPQDQRDHYAAMFERQEFSRLADFIAYELFHASLLQTVVRDQQPDGAWFRLAEKDDYARQLLHVLSSAGRLFMAQEAKDWLRNWELPTALNWLLQLDHVRTVVREDGSDVTLWAETTQGYLVFLVVDG